MNVNNKGRSVPDWIRGWVTKILLAGLVVAQITGCNTGGTTSSNNITPVSTGSAATQTAAGSVALGISAPTGTVKVYLADPSTGAVLSSVDKTLIYTGLDANENVTFGPVTLPYSNEVTLNNVPSTTTDIIVDDPTNPNVEADVEIDVIGGGTTFASDVVMAPRQVGPNGNLLTKDASEGTADGGNPVPVGAGYIQTKTIKLGNALPGSNNTMAGVHATSATTNLPLPYKTNSWLSPILYADNHSKVYLGGGSGVYASYNPQTIWQLPVYPHPWIIYYTTNPAPLGKRQGLKVAPEQTRYAVGALIPAPSGGTNNSKSGYGEFNTTYDTDIITVDPGFQSRSMKVDRMGDYSASFLMRAVDDDKHAASNLPDSALLRLYATRGDPFLRFTAAALPSVNLNHALSPESTAGQILQSKSGVLTVGGTQIAYVVWNGLYGFAGQNNSVRRKWTVLFYPQGSATYTQGEPVQNTGEGGDNSWTVKTTLTFAKPSPANYFAMATVPDQTFTDTTTLQQLANAAFSYPNGTTATYSYAAATQSVTETYAVQASNVLKGTVAPVSGLMPHHYQPDSLHNNDPILQGSPQPLSNGGGKQMAFTLPDGMLQIYNTGTWTDVYPYSGMLPNMPPLNPTDSAGLSLLKQWIENAYVPHWVGDNPPYSGVNIAQGQPSYTQGKFLERNMSVLASVAQIEGTSSSIFKAILQATENTEALYFRQQPVQTAEQPGSAPVYTYYDPLVGSLFQYPQGQGLGNTDFPSDTNVAPQETFGATTRCNDHQFHYGYFVYSAAQIAIYDPTWAAQYKNAINQYIFDVANTSATNPSPVLKFPKLRYWDAYLNHGYSAGFSFADATGNNEESVSEEMNFWEGVAMWGAVTNQPAIMQQGIEHYAMEAYSWYEYWFDVNGNKLQVAQQIAPQNPVNWPGSGGAIIGDAHTGFNTFFGAHPINARGIILIPVTPASFYLAMNTDVVNRFLDEYTAFIQKFNIDPQNPANGVGAISQNNPWYTLLYWQGHLAKYAAMGTPDATHGAANALKNWFNVPPNYDVVNGLVPQVAYTDIGDSGALTYHMIRYMQMQGQPDTWTTATNTPFFMTFVNTQTTPNTRTYVGFNYTTSTMNITFADGTIIPNVPALSTGTLTKNLP